VHGIGLQAQRDGIDAAEVCRAFVDFAGAAPLIGFHAAFDRVLIERQLQTSLGRTLANVWLDLAELAPVLEPQVKGRSLDDWLAHHGIVVAQRHQASADSWATAELLQRLWPLLRRERAAGPDVGALLRLARQRRWLGGGA
jgi:DNA polymerase-3 subunit epsilon